MFILQKIITSSLIGSLMWLILKILAPATKRVFSARWHYYMAFIPVLFFLNVTSLFNPFFRSLKQFFEKNQPGVTTQPIPVQSALGFPHNVIHEPVFNAAINIWNNIWKTIDTIAHYILIIWLIGLLFFFVQKVGEYLIMRRKIFETTVEYFNPFNTARVIKSGYVVTPIIMGVLKPVIVLPDIAISERQLEIILLHETAHLKCGDIILKIIALCANGLHWFNPLAYIANTQIDRLCETACDEKVAKDMTKENRVLYCETILSMLESGISQKNAISIGLCSSKEYIRERLINIMNTKKTTNSAVILSVIAVMIILGIGGTVAYAVSESNSNDIIEITEEINVPVVENLIFDDLHENILEIDMSDDIMPDFIGKNDYSESMRVMLDITGMDGVYITSPVAYITGMDYLNMPIKAIMTLPEGESIPVMVSIK